MAPSALRPTAGRPPRDRRRAVRYAAAGLAVGVGALYAVLLFLVAHAESAAGGENTFGAYLFLAIAYLAGGTLLAVRDRRWVPAVGALLQVVVLTLFVLFGIGVFEYEALRGLHITLWAGVVTGAELVLLGLLSYLAATASRVPERT